MHEFFIIPAHMESNQCSCCNVISHALRHARTYPVTTQKCVIDLCLYLLATMYVQMHVHTYIRT